MAELPVPGVEESQPRGCSCGHKPDFCHKRNAERYCGVVDLRDEIRAAGGLRNLACDPAERVRQISIELKALTDEMATLVGPFRYQAALAESPSPGPEERAAEIGWDGASCSHCRSSECDGIGCGPGPGA